MTGVPHWSAPLVLFGPAAADLIAPQLTVAPTGAIAVGSGLTSEDAPGRARERLILSGPGGDVGPVFAPPASQQALALTFLRGHVIALEGGAAGSLACCSRAVLQTVPAAALGSGQLLASGLAGPSLGALVPVRSGVLATVDSQSGITVARMDRSGRLGRAEMLAGAGPTPPLLATASLRGGGALVAWTAPVHGVQTVTGTTTAPGASAAASGEDGSQNGLIRVATAGADGLPGLPRLVVSVPAGHEIDALAAAPHGSGATLAWTESWSRGDRYRSAVFWSDVSARGSGPARMFGGLDRAAVGVSLAGSAVGDEVLTWQACASGPGTCRVHAALRPRGSGWGAVRDLGPVDADAVPVAAESPDGRSLVGWIAAGRVLARTGAPGATGFAAARVLSRAPDASDLALSDGASGRATAVWIQGTVTQRVVVSRLEP